MDKNLSPRRSVRRVIVMLLPILVILALSLMMNGKSYAQDGPEASPPIVASLTWDWFRAVDLARSTSVNSQIYDSLDPRFVVFPEWEFFDGLDWPDGATVTITVAGKPECETIKESWGFFFNGNFSEGCDLEIGDEVTFTDSATVRTHTVQNLGVSDVDILADTVAGTADEGALVYVWPHETGETLSMTVAAAGTWEVDFSGIYDIVEGSTGRSAIYDGQGNSTAVDWYIPDPRFVVFPEWEFFDGIEWPDGATVTVTVAGKPECETIKESWGFFFNGNFSEGCDLEIGDEVTFTDGVTVRTHTVKNLSVTEIDAAADTVAGAADPGSQVYVWPHETGDTVLVTATLTGTWLADFSAIYDIVEGSDGRSIIYDETGNATAVDWWLPNPYMIIFYEWNTFEGFNWPDGATVTITVDSKPVCTAYAVSWNYNFGGLFPAGCDVEIGDEVTFTDGETVRTHTVRHLKITDIDKAEDRVSGSAEPGDVIFVWPHMYGPTLMVTATLSSTWTADFSGLFDIVPGISICTRIWDEAGNATALDEFLSYELFVPLVNKE